MKKFLVSNNAGFKHDVNVGIAPGKFDTKQLILSALTVLEKSSEDKFVRFVRTIKREELSKCKLFINDDFTTDFPQIPSYHDIEKTWEKTCDIILKKYINYDEYNLGIVIESVKEKICDLESIDCIMEFYDASPLYSDSFEEALTFTLRLIEKFILDSLNENMFFYTVKANVEKAKENYVFLPLYVQGWRSIIKNMKTAGHIKYAIFPECNNTYIIEAYDKELIFKKYVKGMKGVYYSGRFFVKVTNMETAIKVIERLPNISLSDIQKFA